MRRTFGRTACLWFVAVLGIATANAGDYYASPTGKAEGDGSKANPWDLQTALSGGRPGHAVQPGDTIWLRGGTYHGGNWSNELMGKEAAPIVVRSHVGEWARLDGHDVRQNSALRVEKGGWVTFRDFEITDLNPTPSEEGSGVNIGGGVPGVKFVNLVIHDMPYHGFGHWSGAPHSEVYGCILYYNGCTNSKGGSHAYNVYTQNTEADGEKTFKDNILFKNWAVFNIHTYTETPGRLDRFRWEGNTFFGAGALWQNKGAAEGSWGYLCIGGLETIHNLKFIDNMMWRESVWIGYNERNKAANSGAEITGNYVGQAQMVVQHWNDLNGNLAFQRNTIVGLPSMMQLDLQHASASQHDYIWDNNSYYCKENGDTAFFVKDDNPPGNSHPTFAEWQKRLGFDAHSQYAVNYPTTNRIFVRPNQYEPGRANITVYNWMKLDNVSVDVSTIGLNVSDAYEVRDAQNYFGPPVAAGEYDGKPISLPTTMTTVATPGYLPKYPILHTPKEFNIYVIRKTPGVPADSARQAASP